MEQKEQIRLPEIIQTSQKIFREFPLDRGSTRNGGLFYKYVNSFTVNIIKRSYPLFDRMADESYIPRLYEFRRAKDRDYVNVLLMENIQGFNLFEVPESEKPVMFSLSFAQNLALLYKGIIKYKVYHNDLHLKNIIYTPSVPKLTAVDIDSLLPCEGTDNIKANIKNYAELLFSFYFGKLYCQGNFRKNSGLNIENLLLKEGLLEKIHPQIVLFLCRILDYNDIPETFGGVLQ